MESITFKFYNCLSKCRAKMIQDEYHYKKMYQESIEEPEKFWSKVGESLTWYKKWDKIMNAENPESIKWYDGGKVNACYNAIDRHIEAGNGNKIAIIYDSPITNTKTKISYLELHEKVSKLAGTLSSLGVEKGDRVLIYMPVVPETAIAMLATARIGAVHVVVFGGFASEELKSRIEHAEPKIIIAATCSLEGNKLVSYFDMLNKAVDLSRHKPKNCIIFQRKNIKIVPIRANRDLDWDEVVSQGKSVGCVPMDANDPFYILYTSGTTGDPKGLVKPLGGHLAVLAWSLQPTYGVKSGDIAWFISDFGWTLGHSYMLYSPLLNQVTTVFYEGKPTTTPDAGQYFRVIQEYKVNIMMVIPTALRLIRQADPNGLQSKKYNLGSLRCVFVGGEVMDDSIKKWSEKHFKVPVVNQWWQSESGSPMTTISVGLGGAIPKEALNIGTPFFGFQVVILNEDGKECPKEKVGNIVIKLPLPPGMFSTMYKANNRFHKIYFEKFPGYYDTLDMGYMDEKGYVYITSRSDDVFKVSGHRISALAIETVILTHPEIVQACVVAVPDSIRHQTPLCLYVLRLDSDADEETVSKQIVNMVRDELGPVACLRTAVRVRELPTTRSGKIFRGVIADMAANRLKKIPATISNELALHHIREVLVKLGYCKESA